MNSIVQLLSAYELRGVRAEALPKLKGGLRALYRTLEWTRSRPLARPSRAFCSAKFLSPFPQTAQVPGANSLKDAHAALDAAVLAAYGFNTKKDLLAQLLVLNQQVAKRTQLVSREAGANSTQANRTRNQIVESFASRGICGQAVHSVRTETDNSALL